MTARASHTSLPERLGRYEIVSLIGRGAMGEVYRARDPSLDREVAVKTLGGLLLEGLEHRDEYLERFQREARAAARLSHPNIVTVHDLGVDEATGSPFIVMEYVPGVSLATVLRENPVLPLAQALELVAQVGAALEEAHRHGVVHRDIKPGNVFLDPRGRVKVGDFGIARLLPHEPSLRISSPGASPGVNPGSAAAETSQRARGGAELTQAGVSLGTPGYLAPEVVRGARADVRADVFALGVLSYTLLAGRKPFLGVTPQTLAAEVLEREPEPPHLARPEVSPQASAAVMRALEKSPERRTPSVEAFLRELGGDSSAVPATATVLTPSTEARTQRTETVATLPPPPARRWPLVAGLAAALALAGILFWMSRGSARDLVNRPAPASQRRETRPPAATAAPVPPTTRPPAVVRERQGDQRGDRHEPPRKGHGRGRGKGKDKDKKAQ